jgi:hypothetical protein
MPVLVPIAPRLAPWALGLEQSGVLDLVGGVGDGAADVPAFGLGDGATGQKLSDRDGDPLWQPIQGTLCRRRRSAVARKARHAPAT